MQQCVTPTIRSNGCQQLLHWKLSQDCMVESGVLLLVLLGTPWVVELPSANPAQLPCLWL
jgi:hypothetical protein